jgi:Protein of unknown function (DUF3311)
MKWIAALWVVVLIALHQDIWFWKDKTLVFGLMPIGLLYHALFAVTASLTMWMLVKVAWPKEFDALELSNSEKNKKEEGKPS